MNRRYLVEQFNYMLSSRNSSFQRNMKLMGKKRVTQHAIPLRPFIFFFTIK